MKNVADAPPVTVGPLNVANSLFVLAVLTLAIAAFVRSKTPAAVLLVSGEKGFDPDAVALADSADIACYRVTGSDFERVHRTAMPRA